MGEGLQSISLHPSNPSMNCKVISQVQAAFLLSCTASVNGTLSVRGEGTRAMSSERVAGMAKGLVSDVSICSGGLCHVPTFAKP